MDMINKFEHAGKTVKLYYDPDPPNPRTDWDNATILAFRYVVGDVKIEPMTEDEIRQEYAEKGDPILAILPMYAYIHSGITVSTGPFSCSWDSGQVGWAFITQSKSDEMGFGDFDQAKLENVIKSDVKIYDDYLTGQVYGYVVEGIEGDHLESCWGFVGDLAYVEGEAKSAAEYAKDPALDRQAAELESRATYAGV